MAIQHLKHFGKSKKHDKWEYRELTTNQKDFLKCHLLLFHATTMNYFSIGWWRVTKSGLCTTTGNDQLSGWTEKLQSTSQSQTCTKNRSWSLFGGLLWGWSTIAFWIPVKPLYLRSIFSKSMRCAENRNVCSWHWSAWAHLLTTPDCMSHNQCFKSWTNRAMKFCLTHLIHLTSHLLTSHIWLPLLQASRQPFCRQNAAITRRRQKMLSKSLSKAKAWILYHRNKQTYVSLVKMCWL